MAISTGKKAVFGLGQIGLILTGYGMIRLFTGFFVARGFSGVQVFPDFMYRDNLFGYVTAAGIIIALGKVVDAFSGVFSGYVSDRSQCGRRFGKRFGRRSRFLIASAIPLPLLSVLAFFPPLNAGSVLSTITISLCVILFYIFLALYAIPYLALIAELGMTRRERLQLTTIIAFATAVGSFGGNNMLPLMEYLITAFGMDSLFAFRLVIIAFASLSAVFLLVPPLIIREMAATEEELPRDNLGDALKSVFSDQYFMPWLISDFLYRLASAFITTGFAFFVTVLFELPRSEADRFLFTVFAVNMLLFIPVYYVTSKIGTRKMLMIAFLVLFLALSFGIAGGMYPLYPGTQVLILSVLFALPLSVFTVVPYAVVSDLAAAHERKTGKRRAGLYFGFHATASRIAQLVVIILFPLIVPVGSHLERGAGITGLRIVIALAAVVSLAGLVVLHEYREKEVIVLLD